jgi:hypothetical protein
MRLLDGEEAGKNEKARFFKYDGRTLCNVKLFAAISELIQTERSVIRILFGFVDRATSLNLRCVLCVIRYRLVIRTFGILLFTYQVESSLKLEIQYYDRGLKEITI